MFTEKTNIAGLARSFQNNTFNAGEYLKNLCKKIDNKDVHVKAMLPEKNRAERLIRDYEDLEKVFPDPKKRPSLFGVPIGVKDIINVKGFETKAGSKLPPKLFKGKEASVVKRLKKAGALILGKTVTTEFAYFEPGPTRNPHNTEHTPGGSSSGSAAAVASGYTPLAIGTQTIGSIIRPAAYCGVIGYKPSYNRVPKDGVVPFSASADHIGLFAQELHDIKIAASVLCNRWKNDLADEDKEPVIGVIEGKYLEQADDEIITFFEKQVKKLEKAGYKIIRLKALDDIEYINLLHRKMIAAEFASVHEEWFNTYGKFYRKATKKLILDGRKVTMGELSKARMGRLSFRRYIENIRKTHKIDVWLSPATTCSAPKGSNTGSPVMNLPWTYAGMPTITIPAGKSRNKLPLGLQFSGSFPDDEQLLGFVKNIQNSKFQFD